MPIGQAVDRYLKIVDWARARYTRNGFLILDIGGKPSPYSRIEQAAFARYIA